MSLVPPPGLVFEPVILGLEEEAGVLRLVTALPFSEVRMRGQVARRKVVHFGRTYAYEGGPLTTAPPLPDALAFLRERCAKLAGLDPEALVQALLTWYPAGAGIGWHRDAPKFGPTVVGVSLLDEARLRLRRATEAGWETYELLLPPRSAYVLSGEARSDWQHMLPPVKAERYSLTFRTEKLSPSRRRRSGR